MTLAEEGAIMRRLLGDIANRLVHGQPGTNGLTYLAFDSRDYDVVKEALKRWDAAVARGKLR